MLGNIVSKILVGLFWPSRFWGRKQRRFDDTVEFGTAEEVARMLDANPWLAKHAGTVLRLRQREFEQKLDLLLEHGADINSRGTFGHVLAHLLDAPEFVPIVKARGANLEARDEDGRTPIMIYLLDQGPQEIIEALLRAGANPAARDNGKKSVLNYAREYDDHGGNVSAMIETYLAPQGRM